MKVTRRTPEIARPGVIELSENKLKAVMGGCCDEVSGEETGVACCCCCCGTVAAAITTPGREAW